MTAQYSIAAIPPIRDHAPVKVMARQWLQLYQSAPAWVQPVLMLGTLSNAYLAISTFDPLYLAAVAANVSIVPITFMWFEPGINGACKWKIQGVLRDEGFVMPPGTLAPSPFRHSATAASKRWAEETELKDLVDGWGKRNHLRWILTTVAAVLSGYATLCR